MRGHGRRAGRRVGYTSRLHDVKTQVRRSAFRRDWRGNYDDSLRDVNLAG